MTITRRADWYIETGIIAALEASEDLVSLVPAASIIRKNDASEEIDPPWVTVKAENVRREHAFTTVDVYNAHVQLAYTTSIYDDTDCEDVYKIGAAIRDAVETSGFKAAVHTGEANVTVLGVNETDDSESPKLDDKHRRFSGSVVLGITFEVVGA